MSSLSGHAKISAMAVAELRASCSSHPLAGSIQHAQVPTRVTDRDILDVLNLGHWSEWAQRHHFMRSTASQRPYAAYLEAVSWIEENAVAGDGQLMVRARKTLGRADLTPAPANAQLGCPVTPVQGRADALASATYQMYTGAVTTYARVGVRTIPIQVATVSWQQLGNVLHAVQDSFSPSHVERGPGDPGDIQYVLVYEGREKDGHDDHDQRWAAADGLSALGRQAVEASKALLTCIVSTAVLSINQDSHGVTSLHGWDDFRKRWLRPAPGLLSAPTRSPAPRAPREPIGKPFPLHPGKI